MRQVALRSLRVCLSLLLSLSLAFVSWTALPPIALARTTASDSPPNNPTSNPTNNPTSGDTTIDIQPYIDGVESRISEFTLQNGMKFIVMERHQAPIVSFMTYVNVGATYESPGKTGAAHFLEHLAFKGTKRIGTTNYRAEKPVLDQLDRVFDQLQAAKAGNQPAAVDRLETQFQELNAKAASFVEQNKFGQIVEQAGGVGLNATTSADATRYFYSFPANKLELWMSLESERFLEPVFREFYEEKDVILEERRTRSENSPTGKFFEQFLAVALKDGPYGRPIIGYEADIRNLTRQDITKLFRDYYTPDHITAVVVGDVNPEAVQQMAEAYFGRYESRSRAAEPVLETPTQTAPRELTLRLPSEPWYMEGYQRPALDSPDDIVYEVMAGVLVGGRTSRLYRSMVEQQQIALSVDMLDSFPANRFPSIVLLYGVTAPGHTVEELATAFQAELDRLKREPVTMAELDRVKTQARAGLLQVLDSNSGMASLLAEYQAKTGNWRNLFERLKALDAVTPADIQRVAQSTFQPDKVTIGKLLPEEGTGGG